MPRGHGDTHDRIVDVGLKLFCRRGFDATPLRAIADELEMTAAALYYHFPSKDAVLRAIVEPLLTELEEVVRRHGSCPDECELIAEYLDVLIRGKAVVQFVVEDPAVRHHQELGGRFQVQRDALARSLAARPARGRDRVAAAAAIGAMYGAVVDVDDPSRFRATILSAATAALAAAE